MVRTECEKCKNALSGWTGCATLTIPVKEWIRSADWSGSVGSYIAEAENLCPGFVAHPLTTAGLVAHESGVSETQEAPVFIPFIQCLEPMEPGTITFEQCQSCTNPVQISTDTISVTPRKRSEEGNSQAILDGSNSSKTLSGCQCAAGPWREDLLAIKHLAGQLLTEQKLGKDERFQVEWACDLMVSDIDVVNDDGWHITRFAVIGGK